MPSVQLLASISCFPPLARGAVRRAPLEDLLLAGGGAHRLYQVAQVRGTAHEDLLVTDVFVFDLRLAEAEGPAGLMRSIFAILPMKVAGPPLPPPGTLGTTVYMKSDRRWMSSSLSFPA